MIVLGYNGFARSRDLFGELYGRRGIDGHRVLGHDAAAALFVDGVLVHAVEEERLSRVKRTSDFPQCAVDWCLREAGVRPQEVDLFAFPWRFDDGVMRALAADACGHGGTAAALFSDLDKLRTLYEAMISPRSVVAELSDRLGFEVPADRLALVPHHMAHLMCGYYLSGGGDTAFVVSDGRAEYLSAVCGQISDGRVEVFDDMSIPIGDSISQLYSKVTRYLGFVPNNDEYKVMGLTAFGPALPLVTNPFFESGIVALEPGGRYRVGLDNVLTDRQSYYDLFDELFAVSEPPRDLAGRAAVAAAAQDAIERVTAHQVGELARRTEHERLLLEGGLALNCVNNAKIARQQGFADVRVSFGASDPGVAIGAGFHPSFARGCSPPASVTPYLGPTYTAEEMRAAVRARHASVRCRSFSLDDLLDHVVNLLREPVVLGWFTGRAEYGPRALGHRSILANPAHPGIQDLINKRVKKRETFRPFAPIVREDRASHVFDLGTTERSPFMTFTYPVRLEYRGILPGAVHVDGTARIQTVTPDQDSLLAELLARFEAATGVPALINTSFNVAGEPIVCSPDDALNCFLGTDIDYLVMGDMLIEKCGSPRPPERRDRSHDHEI